MSMESAFSAASADNGYTTRFNMATESLEDDASGPLRGLSSSFVLRDENGSLWEQAMWFDCCPDS